LSKEYYTLPVLRVVVFKVQGVADMLILVYYSPVMYNMLQGIFLKLDLPWVLGFSAQSKVQKH